MEFASVVFDIKHRKTLCFHPMFFERKELNYGQWQKKTGNTEDVKQKQIRDEKAEKQQDMNARF